jgi:hypothetical protein
MVLDSLLILHSDMVLMELDMVDLDLVMVDVDLVMVLDSKMVREMEMAM